MSEESQALDVRPPIAGAVYSRDLTTSSVRYAVPQSLIGQWVKCRFVGGSGGILFGTSSVVASLNARSGLAGEVLSPDATSCATFAEGESDQWQLAFEDTHFAVIGAAAQGRFELYVTSR